MAEDAQEGVWCARSWRLWPFLYLPQQLQGGRAPRQGRAAPSSEVLAVALPLSPSAPLPHLARPPCAAVTTPGRMPFLCRFTKRRSVSCLHRIVHASLCPHS